jgi:hypothetical protein
LRLGNERNLIQIDLVERPSALFGTMDAWVIDQNTVHHLSRHREEVAALFHSLS